MCYCWKKENGMYNVHCTFMSPISMQNVLCKHLLDMIPKTKSSAVKQQSKKIYYNGCMKTPGKVESF